MPCKIEMPALDRLQELISDEQFEVIAIAVEKTNILKIQEFYEEIDIDMLGNTFQVGESVVMSTGGGAIDQYDIENALGLKDGALDEAN